MKALVFIVLFFLIAAFFIISENKLALKDKEARDEFSKQYYSWLNKTYENAQSVTGYVAKLDWLPER